MAFLRVKKLLCGAVLLAVAAAAPDAWAEPPAGAVVNVNGRVLTERDLSEAMKSVLPPYFHKTDEEKMARYRSQGIERLIEDELFYQGALAMGMKPDRKALKEEKERTVKRLGGRKKFEEALRQYELTEDRYMELLAKRMLVPGFVKEQIEDKAAVGEMEAKAYYEANISDYKRPEARAIHHILVKVDPAATAEDARQKEEKAIDLLRKLKEGADFEALAWEHSEDDYRVKGGNLGLVHMGMLDPAVEAEAWKPGPGELSGVVRTLFGFHIIRVDEVRPPEQLQYEAVAGKIKKSLYDKRLKETRERVLNELRSKARIEVYAK